MRPQHPDRRQGHRAGSEEVEDDREIPARPRSLDPVARGVLGQVQGLGAVGEERTVAAGGVKGGAQLERGEMGHELRRSLALGAREPIDVAEEVVVR